LSSEENKEGVGDSVSGVGSERTIPYLLLAPTIAVLLALTIYPLIYSIKVSFQTESGTFNLLKLLAVGV
jgi:multiple sugar transport system permease protein